uniref:Uncharacterized protein n=1 Tax=Glossina austeni TaxID=7395 RepID=A0A1A9VAK2_GLOAU
MLAGAKKSFGSLILEGKLRAVHGLSDVDQQNRKDRPLALSDFIVAKHKLSALITENAIKAFAFSMDRKRRHRQLLERHSLLFNAIKDNNFICDCRLQWLYELKNRTRHQQLRDSLEEFVCTLQEPHLYNFIEPVPTHILDLLNIGGLGGLSGISSDKFVMNVANNRKRMSKTRPILSNQRRNTNNQVDGQMQLTDDHLEGHKHAQHDNDVLNANHENQVDNIDMLPKQPLGFKVRLFILKPALLPCHDELSDPTELPLSRDLMDARSSNVQILPVGAATTISVNYHLLLLLLAIVCSAQVDNEEKDDENM